MKRSADELCQERDDPLGAALTDVRDGVVRLGIACRGLDPADPIFDELLRLDETVERLDCFLDTA
ncbi:MAG: hypothetical protein ACR2HI_08425 [Gaiella sp.]